MFYTDVDYDGDGDYDYRGIYMNLYRTDDTTSSSSSASNQKTNGYYTGNYYWFSYDPIEWKILSITDGKALIISNLLLDSQDYYSSADTSTTYHNGGYGYANNYEYSNIRKFLNDDFYNTAFSTLEKGIIELTTVNNSASTTASSSNSYACSTTYDKLFLLSYSEVNQYFTSDSARKTSGTDYAKSQGLYYYSGSLGSGYYWWTRSPSTIEPYYVSRVIYNGTIDAYKATKSIYGVRPALWINL